LNVSGKYDVGITAGVCSTPTTQRQNVFVAMEIKTPGAFRKNTAQGEATAIAAALHSSLRVVTVYTDLADNWLLMWYTGAGVQKGFSHHLLSRPAAISFLCAWINYNNSHVKGESDLAKVAQDPPEPFQDIKKFSLQGAAEPLDLEARDDDELDRLRELDGGAYMDQWIVEQLILRSIGPKAFERDEPYTEPYTLPSPQSLLAL